LTAKTKQKEKLIMNRVAIEVTIKRTVLLRRDVWEDSFSKQLPTDMEDLEMLQDESLTISDELTDSKVSTMKV
jgi:hypothetical protein